MTIKFQAKISCDGDCGQDLKVPAKMFSEAASGIRDAGWTYTNVAGELKTFCDWSPCVDKRERADTKVVAGL